MTKLMLPMYDKKEYKREISNPDLWIPCLEVMAKK